MKFKEKLAYQFVRDDIVRGDLIHILCFIRGFEKAREMSACLINDSIRNPKYTNLTYPNAIDEIVADIKGLGEEEELINGAR